MFGFNFVGCLFKIFESKKSFISFIIELVFVLISHKIIIILDLALTFLAVCLLYLKLKLEKC